MSAYDIHRRPTKFLRRLNQQKHYQLETEETEYEKIKESSQTPRILQAGNRLVNYSASRRQGPQVTEN